MGCAVSSCGRRANLEQGCWLLALQLALAESQYDLAAELLRFVVPPTENDNVFASITGANGLMQPRGVAKNSSSTPPRVRRQPIAALLDLLPAVRHPG
jgi:hypothetical protein